VFDLFPTRHGFCLSLLSSAAPYSFFDDTSIGLILIFQSAFYPLPLFLDLLSADSTTVFVDAGMTKGCRPCYLACPFTFFA